MDISRKIILKIRKIEMSINRSKRFKIFWKLIRVEYIAIVVSLFCGNIPVYP